LLWQLGKRNPYILLVEGSLDNHYIWKVYKKVKAKLPHQTWTYNQKNVYKDTIKTLAHPIFITALFTIVRLQNRPDVLHCWIIWNY
jgi:hypothetical protein